MHLRRPGAWWIHHSPLILATPPTIGSWRGASLLSTERCTMNAPRLMSRSEHRNDIHMTHVPRLAAGVMGTAEMQRVRRPNDPFPCYHLREFTGHKRRSRTPRHYSSTRLSPREHAIIQWLAQPGGSARRVCPWIVCPSHVSHISVVTALDREPATSERDREHSGSVRSPLPEVRDDAPGPRRDAHPMP